MTFAWLAFFDAILAIAMIAAGMVGAHFYLLAPFMGFQLFALGFLLSILGFFVGLLAIFLTRTAQARAGRNRAVLAHGGMRRDSAAVDLDGAAQFQVSADQRHHDRFRPFARVRLRAEAAA